jgi:hypothetical protein
LLQTTQYNKVLELLDSSVYLKSFKFIPTFVAKGSKMPAIAAQEEGGKKQLMQA